MDCGLNKSVRYCVVLTSSVLLQLPQGPQQFPIAFVAFIVLAVEQDFLGISEQAGDTGQKGGNIRHTL